MKSTKNPSLENLQIPSMVSQNPSINEVQQLQFCDIKVIQQAQSLSRAIQKAAEQCQNNAVALALASDRYPGLPIERALATVLIDVNYFAEKCTRYASQFAEIEKAERTRLEPIRRCATERLFVIVGRLSSIEQTLKSFDAQTRARRDTLGKSGIDEATIAGLPPLHDCKALEHERVALAPEKAALEHFLKHGDERHLPAEFVVTEPPNMKVTWPAAPLPASASKVYDLAV